MGTVSNGQAEHPKRSRLPRAQRKAQLIEVAERVFAQRGFDGAAIEEIAREAGVDRALIYQYFDSKQGLYEACVNAALTALQKRVAAAIEGLSADLDEGPRMQIAFRGVKALFEFVHDHSTGWDVLFGAGWSVDPGSDISPPPVDMLDYVTGILAIEYGDAPRELLELTAAQLIGASWAASLWWRQRSDMSVDQIAEHHLRFCMTSLQNLQYPQERDEV